MTLAARIVIFAHWFVGWLRLDHGYLGSALGNLQILPFVANPQLSAQTQLDAQMLPFHSAFHLSPRNLVASARERKSVVVGDHAIVHMAQGRGQILVWRQW